MSLNQDIDVLPHLHILVNVWLQKKDDDGQNANSKESQSQWWDSNKHNRRGDNIPEQLQTEKYRTHYYYIIAFFSIIFI